MVISVNIYVAKHNCSVQLYLKQGVIGAVDFGQLWINKGITTSYKPMSVFYPPQLPLNVVILPLKRRYSDLKTPLKRRYRSP